MMTRKNVFVLTFFIGFVLFGCSFVKPQQIPVDKGTAEPGGAVSRGETKINFSARPSRLGILFLRSNWSMQ